MKYVGPLLAGGLTLTIVLLVGVFSFLPAKLPAQPAAEQAAAVDMNSPAQIVISPGDTSQFEAMISEREATYQTQMAELNLALQERQTTYQTQIQDLSVQITTAQNQLAELKAQEQNLPAQLTELKNTRAERQSLYQTQLQQLQNQYQECW